MTELVGRIACGATSARPDQGEPSEHAVAERDPPRGLPDPGMSSPPGAANALNVKSVVALAEHRAVKFVRDQVRGDRDAAGSSRRAR